MHPLTVGISIFNDELRREALACVRTLGVRILFEQAQQLETLMVKRCQPNFLLVSAAPEGEPIDELVRRVKAVSPETLVAAVHGTADSELILEAMRAGTDEFLISPLGEKLRSAVGRASALLASREIARRPTGKVIGVVSAKGGCGATTLACHVARELQRGDSNVLLADFDLDAGLVGFLMQAPPQYSILDAMKNTYRLDQSLWKALVTSGGPRLDVIPSPNGLTLTDGWTPANVRDVFRLIRSMYSWVVADLGRTFSPITLTLLEDLDEILLVVNPSLLALYQAKRFVQRALDLGVHRRHLHLVVNRVPKRSDVEPEELERMLGLPVYAEIPERTELEEAFTAGKLVPEGSELGRRFAALAAKIAGPQETPAKSKVSWFGSARKAQPSTLGL